MQVGREVELKSGRWRAVVSPDRGGRLKWLGEMTPTGKASWLRPLINERGVPVGGGGVRLAPPSVVEESLARFVPDPGSFEEPWQVTLQTSDRITMMLHPRGPSPGSWGYQASQSLRLDEHRLEWELSVCNLSRMPMPARLGWLLQFPDDFAEAAWLDDTLDALREPDRGHEERRDPWCGLATISGAGGRLVLLRGAPPLDTLLHERHASRAVVQLRLMTADSPRATPLPRGEELTLRLSIDLLEPRDPPLPVVRPDKPSGPLIL